MNRTVSINKQALQDAIVAGLTHAGEHDWFVCVDKEGSPEVCHNTSVGFHDLYQVMDCGLMSFEDSEGRHYDDPDYDAEGVAQWLIDEADLELEFEDSVWCNKREDLITFTSTFKIEPSR